MSQTNTEQDVNLNETIVTVSLPRSYYRAGWLIAKMLGYDSFDEYVSEVVKTDIRSELDGSGSLDIDRDASRRILGGSINETDTE
ncbi:MAG TPA: hypothetical protein VIR31_06420 [Nitrososphaeraceae archaeon]